MAKKYKIALIINSILFLICLVLFCSYVKYINSPSNNPLVIVSDGLSINYRDGNEIELNGKKVTINFSVTNNNDKDSIYEIVLDGVTTDNLEFTLEEKNDLKEDLNGTINEGIIASDISISPNTTHSYKLTITSKERVYLTFTLDVSNMELEEEYFASTILKNNEVKKSSTTTIGVDVATTDEGLIESYDDYGSTYYFRGNVSNNYVTFANLTWRIVRINGDESVRLVLDSLTGTNSNFYGSDTTNLEDMLDFSKSNIYEYLNSYYEEYLSDYDKNIVSMKYCVDDTLIGGDKDYYASYRRVSIDYNPVFNCLGNSISSKIGLLTADEVIMAGATRGSDNTSYYLSSDSSFWTLTPEYSDTSNVYYFLVSSSGKLGDSSQGSYYRGVKPVINILKRTTVTGTGTQDDPYVIE